MLKKQIKVACANCGKESVIAINADNLELTHSEEKGQNQMGVESTYVLNEELTCPECGAKWKSISIFEYPQGIVECATGNV